MDSSSKYINIPPQDIISEDLLPYIIHGVLNNPASSINFSGYMNNFICRFIENNDQDILITDKSRLYRSIWKIILEELYKTYLPNEQYDFQWTLEITSYSITICHLTNLNFDKNIDSELQIIKKIKNITVNDIESNFDNAMKEIGFDGVYLPNNLVGLIPEKLIPKTKVNQLKYLLMLMNFPPLEELAIFNGKYIVKLQNDFKLLLAFGDTSQKRFNQIITSKFNISDFVTDKVKMHNILQRSFYNIPHVVFQKYGLDFIESNKKLSNYQSDIKAIRKIAKKITHEYTDKINDNIICPCCGETSTFTLPEEVIQYQLLMGNRKLSKELSLILIDDYIEYYKKEIVDATLNILKNLNLLFNNVEDQKCIILVEGSSEEIFIPIIAMRKGISLLERKIKVFNAQSKEKLFERFKELKSNYPNLKIICMLDSDAKKQYNDINRIIDKQLNKYRVIYIEKGCFEDIFNRNTSISVINNIYCNGEPIKYEDFDSQKDFIKNIKRILYEKKKIEFDKVKFAKAIALEIDIKSLPKEIKRLLKFATDFTAFNTFIKS